VPRQTGTIVMPVITTVNQISQKRPMVPLLEYDLVPCNICQNRPRSLEEPLLRTLVGTSKTLRTRKAKESTSNIDF